MAAAPRSFWTGHLRLALVTIPIRLVSATRSEDKIALHQVDRKSNQRIRYQKVAAESGHKVASEDIVQAYQADDGSYVLFERDELDALKLSTRHTVELLEFVEACSIDPIYFDNPYYVLPDGEVAEEGYRVLRDAMRSSKKVGVGQLTMRGRENLVALKPCGAGLSLETLRYQSEIKDADDIFAGIGTGALRAGLTDMAKKLIDERASKFDPDEYKNHYAEALRELVKSKLKGGLNVQVSGGDETRPAGTVIDFMEALRRSTGAKSGSSKISSSADKKPASVKPRKAKAKTTKTAAAASAGDSRKRSSADRKTADRKSKARA